MKVISYAKNVELSTGKIKLQSDDYKAAKHDF
jgi:hypothetical protein